ncbi:hypothetical protein AMQ84_23770 [Paenibacillus riograndensis]|uniref:Uncharacterized protein n=1 Tax=Paenibacillus riograndensis TaxID=483937 RepID=A0A132TNI1_9BACL|nr:hypothetical protein [Paenibacillus riograndensis]KWX72938.1 hypothetical protein AMQ84_23770 [Paenibacillus riograndensis]KWX85577.1 hypothetical protein AMQ83_23925 [Paenibacillus riograndensis]
MENRNWCFKVPGDPDGREKVINTSEVKSVYDLLDLLHRDELQGSQKKQAVLLPFVSRIMKKRRHPSA